MDFDVASEHVLLRDSLRRTLASTDSGGAWTRCVELGLAGLDCRESAPTTDDALAMTVVQEELGRALLPVPFVTSVVEAGALARVGGHGMVSDVEAGRIVATADDVGRGRYGFDGEPVRAVASGDGWRLDGKRALVPFADCADAIVLPARTRNDGALTLFVVRASAHGVGVARVARLDGHPAGDLDLNGVVVPDTARLGAIDGGRPLLEGVRRMAIVALVAEAVGCMDALLALTLDYLRTRQQFGRPLAAFQALRHRAADMYVAVEQARSMMLYAALTASDPDPDARVRAVAAAKVQAGRAARFVGQQAIQLHGGIGLADEHRAGHYLQRLTAIELAFGDADDHLTALGERGGLYAPADPVGR
ncbi:MAG: acyl-CoA dehydrogenase family protein [Burkholderiales bacterium]